MKAYILSREAKIEPFGDCARDCLIGNKPLRQLQAETLRALGLEPIFVADQSQVIDSEEHVVLNDNLYFSTQLLREFITRSRQRGKATVCALNRGEITLRTAVVVQDVVLHPCHVEYNLRYSPGTNGSNDYMAVVIDPDELHATIAMPVHMCGSDKYTIPMTHKFVIQIDHWVNLWIANIVAALAMGAKLRKSSRIRQLFLALKAHSFNQWKILRHINVVGNNCDIHPTAYIEGSVVGNRVSLGAGAIVRNSIVGDNVSIGNGVVIEESVVGDGCVILNGRLIFSVFYPRTFSVAEMVTASFVGQDSFIGLNSTMTDFRLDGRNVTVIQDGKLVDSSQRFLGACLGHGVYLGSGCIVAPGRSVPCGFRLALTEDKVVRNCLGEGHAIEGYRLVQKAENR